MKTVIGLAAQITALVLVLIAAYIFGKEQYIQACFFMACAIYCKTIAIENQEVTK